MTWQIQVNIVSILVDINIKAEIYVGSVSQTDFARMLICVTIIII
jgi:hypothetical protein